MEQVTGNYNQIGVGGHDVSNGPREHTGDVRLALIGAVRCLAMVLPAAKMYVGDVSEFHSAMAVPGTEL